MKKLIVISGFLLTVSLQSNAQVVSQKIGNNPTLINASAALEVESTNKGVLVPRVTLTGTADATTIATPATSLLVYNTATAGTSPNDVTPGFYYWNGTAWVRMASGNALMSEVDGVIGNEVLDAVTNGGLTRTGTGTALDPYKLKISDGTASGEVLTWDGTKWVAQASSADWKLTGNAGTTAGTNFIGTTDAVDFVAKTNGTEAMRITSVQRVGINSTAPKSLLDVNGSFGLPIVSGTANITLDATHATVRVDATAGDKTITLPAAATATGRMYHVIKSDASANKIIFSTTIQASGYTFTQANVPGEYKIQSDGTNWVLIQ